MTLGLLWGRRRRRRAGIRDGGYRKEKEKESFDEGGEPKVEPYVGRGEVDLGPGEDDISREESSGTEEPTDLERQTKRMLGVSPAQATSSNSTGHSAISPLPTKSQLISSPIDSTTSQSDPSPTDLSPIIDEGRRSPVRREHEVEYVRHTDGGMVQVELPPLYSDVPRG